MSRLIFALLILITFSLSSLSPFVSQAYSSGNCATNYRITYSPSYFAENSPITMNFFINDTNVVNELNGKKVRLHFLGMFGTYYGNPITVSSNSFSIPIGKAWNYNPQSPGTHNAYLDWSQDGQSFTELCKDIQYQVGTGNSCTLGKLPDRVPPGSSTDIKFFGKANKQYFLFMNQHVLTPINAQGERYTDNSGQGVFENVKFPTKDGTKVTVWVCRDQFTSDCDEKISCQQDVIVTITAPPISPPKPGPVLSPADPLSRGTTAPTGQPALSGGKPCDGGTGIETAIGCIHTNPAAFVQDFMKFVIGISGGLAFLMMLLGAFQMLTSSGNPDTLKAGQERLTSAVIGLLFVIFAVLLLQIIGANVLGLPDFKP